VDHGAPGIFGFPEEFVSDRICTSVNIKTFGILQLHAQKLNEVIQTMHNNGKFRQMVVYVEACESGSLFHGLLPSNINGTDVML